MLALTGTADESTWEAIVAQLTLKQPKKLFICFARIWVYQCVNEKMKKDTTS